LKIILFANIASKARHSVKSHQKPH